MPEGDTVHRAAATLSAALAGGMVTRFELRVPGSATADLRGATVHEVAARGKHLLLRAGGFTLHSQLKMEGRWVLQPPRGRRGGPAHAVRAIVGVDDGPGGPGGACDAVGFDLAGVSVLPAAEESRLVGHLGPDPLADDWDAAVAAARLGDDPRSVHVALQDQRSVAGFGNEYASELLFLRGILPTTPASDVDAAALVALGARVIRANLARPRRTFTGDTRAGRTTWVYGRARQPCRRCGAFVQTATLGADPTRERVVFWCPNCQR